MAQTVGFLSPDPGDMKAAELVQLYCLVGAVDMPGQSSIGGVRGTCIDGGSSQPM